MTDHRLSKRCKTALIGSISVCALLVIVTGVQAASGAGPIASHTSSAVRASVRAVQPAVSGLFQVHAPRAWVDALDESGHPGANGVPDFLDSWEAFGARTSSAILKNGYAFKTIDGLNHEVLYAGVERSAPNGAGTVDVEFNQHVFITAADGSPQGERAVGDLRIVAEFDAAGNVGATRFERYSAEGAKGSGKFIAIALLAGEGCDSSGAACVVVNGGLLEVGYNSTLLGRPEKDFIGIQITTRDSEGGTIRILAALAGVSDGCVKEVGGVNNPTCTANDVRLAGVKDVVIAQGDTCNLSDPNDTITVTSFTGIFTSGPQRYDIGSYVAIDGGGADGARSGSCTRFAFERDKDGLTNLDGDTCGDVAANQTAEIPMGPITIKCSDAFHLVNGVVTAGGDGNIDFFHCETWAQNANEIICRSSTDAKAGSPSKCGCGLIDATAGFCVASDDGNACTEDVCRGSCQPVSGSGGSGTACTQNSDCTVTGESCRNITPQHINKANDTVCGTDPSSSVCDSAPTCQAGVCTPTYTTVECRAADGECDEPENCTGSSAQCPTDAVKGTGVGCTDDGNVCTNDVCDGTSKSCTHPAVDDGPRTGCTGGGDQCNDGSACVSGVCQAASPKEDGTDCENGTPGGDCDDQDECASGVCVEKYKADTVVCREKDGVCDKEEKCTGTSADCPADGFIGADERVVCRDRANPCDAAEECDGTGPLCPGDLCQQGGAPSGTFICTEGGSS